MDEREILISKTTEKATKEAKKQNLNEAQAKVYVDEKVKEALEKFDKEITEIKTKSTEQTEKKAEQKAKSTKQIEKKYIVYTPVKNFCGVIAKVHFAYGKAEVKPGWILNWFIEHGYKVEEVSE